LQYDKTSSYAMTNSVDG